MTLIIILAVFILTAIALAIAEWNHPLHIDKAPDWDIMKRIARRRRGKVWGSDE